MILTKQVSAILTHYAHESSGVVANLARMLNTGHLAGTGKLLILPVDQGFEHGPARSFAKNPAAYDPLYHVELAIEAGLSAYAAPLGMIEEAAVYAKGRIPLILKMNSSNSLVSNQVEPDQALLGSIDEALYMGCSAVGFTIYPSSDSFLPMIEEVAELIKQAKSSGLAVVIWSYPRGGDLSKEGETALDTVAYAAHMAALMGANIIKVKPPELHLEREAAAKVYEQCNIKRDTLAARVEHIMQASFAGKRLVVFSGGGAKSDSDILNEITQLKDGGASGSIIGRNTFQRPRAEALKLLAEIIKIYKAV